MPIATVGEKPEKKKTPKQILVIGDDQEKQLKEWLVANPNYQSAAKTQAVVVEIERRPNTIHIAGTRG